MSRVPKVGFIGAGRMAEAMIAGMLRSSFEASNIMVSDINQERKELMSSEYK